MEPGSVPGTLHFSLTTLYGSNFEGGHFSNRGTAADGSSVTVPLYRHEVSLDYVRVELALQYALGDGWDVIGRIPWEQKQQDAGIRSMEAASSEQLASMLRNIDLHHRSVTLRGVGDLMFLGRRRWSGLWREADVLSVAAGTTIPTGRTIENPYQQGDAGIQHLHIQFGTGTPDPLVEASYSAPIGEHFSAGAYLNGRFSFKENNRTFRAPPEASVAIHVAHRPTTRLQLRLEGAVYAQGYGYWAGVRDENTGLLGTSVAGGATWQFERASVSVDVRYPLSQRTLTEGDAFTQGPTVIVNVGSVLRRARNPVTSP